jgi:hypothetical protein
MFIDLVGDHQEIVLDGQRRQRLQLSALQHRAGGVVRAVEQQRTGGGRDRAGQRVEIEREPVSVGHQWHTPPGRAGQRHRGGVGVVVGLDEQHLITRAHQGQQCGADGFGGADGDEYLGVRIVYQPVVGCLVFDDGIA